MAGEATRRKAVAARQRAARRLGGSAGGGSSNKKMLTSEGHIAQPSVSQRVVRLGRLGLCPRGHLWVSKVGL